MAILDHSKTAITPTAGFIQFVFFDEANNQTIILGGAGFDTVGRVDSEWDAVPLFLGESSFQADRLDAICDITDDRVISAETCVRYLRQPIDVLISEGRKALAVELAGYKGVAA